MRRAVVPTIIGSIFPSVDGCGPHVSPSLIFSIMKRMHGIYCNKIKKSMDGFYKPRMGALKDGVESTLVNLSLIHI